MNSPVARQHPSSNDMPHVGLMLQFQKLAFDITGKTRWLGRQGKLAESRYAPAFRTLAQKLDQWKFPPEAYLKWALTTDTQTLIDSPHLLAADWRLAAYNKYREKSLSNLLKPEDDKLVQTPLDLVRANLLSDVEFLESWKEFMPDYSQRVLSQCHALSPYFLATDTYFLEHMRKGEAPAQVGEKVTSLLRKFNVDTHYYQQVRNARNDAIRVVAGK